MSDRNKPDNPMGNGIAIGISPGVVFGLLFDNLASWTKAVSEKYNNR